MIKIQKQDIPQILIDNQEIWTKQLTDAINKYGEYSKIPDSEKNHLISHYRHKDIQNALSISSHGKCAFCECKPGESSNIEVEHFEPKSRYPDLTFKWDNLLPACRKCNEAKLDFDTHTTPIINPSKENPEALLTYDNVRIAPLPNSGEEQKAQDTIDVCNLNCPRLYKARSELMVSMTEYFDEVREKIKLISEADTPQKRKYRITKLNNSIETIDSLLDESNTYSGYCRWLVTTFPEYQTAKQLISDIISDNE